ncbi:MAG TPA: LacI family DNA-binding transcriptional regulator [Cellulomonas sp.]
MHSAQHAPVAPTTARPAVPVTRAAGGGTGRVTIRAVAAHAGVSRQTVSNALNSPDRLSAGTLARVRRSVEALGYRPDRAARALSSRRSGLIGIRVGATAHRTASHPDRLLHELVGAVRPYGYRLVAFDAPYGDDDAEIATYAELLAGHDVDAVIVADTHPGDRRPGWLADRDAAFVAHGHPWGDPTATHTWVDVDGAAGIALAVQHLAALGHRSIAFLGWPADGAGGDARRAGWRQAVTRLGLTAGPDLVADADEAAQGAAALAPVLAAGPATAVVCASDALALGALVAVTDAGLVPGADVAVTGYDDSDLARVARPGLTSVRQPVRLVAQTLVAHVLARIDGPGTGPDQDLPPAGFVAPELVVRPSTAPAATPPTALPTAPTAPGARTAAPRGHRTTRPVPTPA